MFFRSIFGEKNRKCGSKKKRKSTYSDTTDFQPTAQQIKLSLNPLHFLLIDHKYVMKWGNYHEGLFPQHFGRKNSEIWIWGTKIDDATDYQPTAQQVKLGLNLL